MENSPPRETPSLESIQDQELVNNSTESSRASTERRGVTAFRTLIELYYKRQRRSIYKMLNDTRALWSLRTLARQQEDQQKAFAELPDADLSLTLLIKATSFPRFSELPVELQWQVQCRIVEPVTHQVYFGRIGWFISGDTVLARLSEPPIPAAFTIDRENFNNSLAHEYQVLQVPMMRDLGDVTFIPIAYRNMFFHKKNDGIRICCDGLLGLTNDEGFWARDNFLVTTTKLVLTIDDLYQWDEDVENWDEDYPQYEPVLAHLINLEKLTLVCGHKICGCMLCNWTSLQTFRNSNNYENAARCIGYFKGVFQDLKDQGLRSTVPEIELKLPHHHYHKHERSYDKILRCIRKLFQES